MAVSDRQAIYRFTERPFFFVGDGLERHAGELGREAFQELVVLWGAQQQRVARLAGVLGVQVVTVEPTGEREEWPDVDRQLAEAGLTGSELAIKLKLFEAAAEEYERRPSRPKFGTTLQAADVTLGSLARVFAFLDPVKEAKEVIEFLFDRGRGWFRKKSLRSRR